MPKLFANSHLSCGNSCVTLMSMLEVQIFCDSPDKLHVDAEHIRSDKIYNPVFGGGW